METDRAPSPFELEQAAATAWPDGMPTEEQAFLRSLSPARRDEVVRRLWAVTSAEDGDRPDLGLIAARAGIGRTLLFDLRRRWDAKRTLRSLAPYAKRETALPAPSGRGEALASLAMRHTEERGYARAQIMSYPLEANGVIADRVAVHAHSRLDRRTLIAIVRQERRLLHRAPTNLLGVYGRTLLADISAIDLAIEVDGRREIALLAVVVERASTLVLGHAVGARKHAIDLQFAAAERSVARLAALKADVSAGTEVSMEVVVGPGSGPKVDTLCHNVGYALGTGSAISRGRLRFGRRMAALIGQPGRIRLRPTFTVPSSRAKPPASIATESTLTLDEADALVAAEIELHNRSALDALRMVGLAGGGEERGAMATLLADVFGPNIDL